MSKWILPVILICIFIIFNKSIDPIIASLLKENDLALLHDQVDEFLFERIKKSKPILFLFIFWGYLDYSIPYLFIVFFLFIFFLKKDYWHLKNQHKKKSNLLKFQFPIWLRQLQILLQTNTVGQSLNLSYEHAPLLIQEDLKQLIQSIENDAVSISPYLNFLKSYRLCEIERAMKLLYRYNTVGKDDAYMQFNRMIQTTTKWLRNEREVHHKDALLLYEWFAIVPLLGVTVLFLAIMCEVVMNMFTNGI